MAFSRITCDDFIAKSFLSYIVGDIPLSSLKCDSTFFEYMGEDHSKMAFFRSYVELMRKKYPDFGKACFVDSTPLPNDIDSRFSALYSHGIGATSMQMRLILILDESTLRPIWFDIIPVNILDINTLCHRNSSAFSSTSFKGRRVVVINRYSYLLPDIAD